MRRDISDLLRYHPGPRAMFPAFYLGPAVVLFAFCRWTNILVMSGVPLVGDIQPGDLLLDLYIGKPWLGLMAGIAYGTVPFLLIIRSLRAVATNPTELNRHAAWLLLPSAQRKGLRRKLWRRRDRVVMPACIIVAMLVLVATAMTLRFSLLAALAISLIAFIVTVPAGRLQYRRIIARLTNPDVVGLDASRHWTAVQKKARRRLLIISVFLLCALAALACFAGPWLLSIRTETIIMIAERGGELPPETVTKLEERLERRPKDPWTRAQLVGHYWSNAETSDDEHQALKRHLSWVTHNHPDGILGRRLDDIRSSRQSGQEPSS